MGLQADRLVFVTVGTDHHPFHRLVQWVDAWATSSATRGMHCFVQAGTSAPPRKVEWQDFVPYHEMENAIRRAAIVVCHGGPGTFMLCRHLGKKPIVVPRLRSLGEHIDDHQVPIARRMASLGAIELAETRERFVEVMDRAAANPELLWLGDSQQRPTEAIQRFEQLVAQLLETPKAWPASRDGAPPVLRRMNLVATQRRGVRRRRAST